MLLLFKYLYALISIQLLVHAAYFNEHEYKLQKWNTFKIQFNKKYSTAEEEQYRMKIYLDNMDEIAKHNELYKKGEVTYEKGITQFVDLTSKEFAELYLNNIGPNPIPNVHVNISLPPNQGPPPQTKNWFDEGAVTRVKDQARYCQCCWAFASAGSIESHYFIKYRQLVEFSEKQLVDCVANGRGTENVFGFGGRVDDALRYVIRAGGIATERSYPFVDWRERCKNYFIPMNQKVPIKNVMMVYPQNEKNVENVVGLIGPVTAYIDATGLEYYTRGVYHSSRCYNVPQKLNHAVLIVGYGTTARGQDYWLVKNSWGVTWGERGYVKVARNAGNMCGIATENYFPTL